MTHWTAQANALLLGRKTYTGLAASWPLLGDDDPIAAVLNRIPKYVASRTLETLTWSNPHLIEGDIAEQVSALKQ